MKKIPLHIISENNTFAEEAKTELKKAKIINPIDIESCDELDKCLENLKTDTINFVVTDYNKTLVDKLKSKLESPKYILCDVKIIIRNPITSEEKNEVSTDDDDFILPENPNEFHEIHKTMNQLLELRESKNKFKKKNYVIAGILGVILIVVVLMSWL